MNAAEIRGLNTEEIKNKIDETHKALFNLRFQAASGQLEDFNRVTVLRRDVARLKTILRERELAARAGLGETDQAQAAEPAPRRRSLRSVLQRGKK